jgi:hypothetical protein
LRCTRYSLSNARDSCFDRRPSPSGLGARGLRPAIPAIACFIGHVGAARVYDLWLKTRGFSGRPAAHSGAKKPKNLKRAGRKNKNLAFAGWSKGDFVRWREKPKAALTAARGFCKLRKSWSKFRFRSETKPGRRRSAPGPENQIPIPLTSRPNMKNEHEEDLGLGADLQTWMRQLNRRRALKLLAGATLMPLVARGVEGVDLSGDGGTTDSNTTGGCAKFPEETAGPYPGDGSNGGANALALSPGLCAATFVPASPEPRAWRRAFCSPSTSPW